MRALQVSGPRKSTFDMSLSIGLSLEGARLQVYLPSGPLAYDIFRVR